MKNESATYLIVGNSTAAVGGIEGIRGLDPEGSVTVVSREPDHTYSRPLISYLLAGEVDEKDMYYRSAGFYRAHGVNARLGVEVTGVDPDARRVTCADGLRIGYDELLIATGGSPVMPPIAGTDARGVFTFLSWDDCRAVEEFLSPGSPACAAIVGGGLIGIKAAEALRARGVGVTVVELEERVLPLMLDEEAAGLAAQALESAGVSLICGVRAERIAVEDGAVVGLDLEGGARLDCDMVILAVGVRPQTAVVRGTKIETDQGILIDGRCRTSCEHVYAAGDVAQAAGEAGVLPIFPSAYRQGRIAGANMAGGSETLGIEFPMNSVQVFDLPIISVGRATGNGRSVLSRMNGRSYKKMVLDGDRIVGALFVGDIDRAGIVTGMMRQEVNVSQMKGLLLTDEFGMVSVPPDYRKHVVQGDGIEV
jgi:NAD(P)H-nitrite reductase large subunit